MYFKGNSIYFFITLYYFSPTSDGIPFVGLYIFLLDYSLIYINIEFFMKAR